MKSPVRFFLFRIYYYQRKHHVLVQPKNLLSLFKGESESTSTLIGRFCGVFGHYALCHSCGFCHFLFHVVLFTCHQYLSI